MEISIGAVSKLLNLTPRIFFALWVSGALLLFLPSAIAVPLGIDTFRDDYRRWLGPATLAAFVLWVSHALVTVPRWASSGFEIRRAKSAIVTRLDELNREEWLVLAFFLHSGAPTQFLWLNFPPARALVAKGLLRPASGSGNRFAWPYTVPEFVWTEMIARRSTLFPELDSNEAKQFFERFDNYQREFTLFR